MPCLESRDWAWVCQILYSAMKTPEPPRSSKSRDKAEEKGAPKAETPMARFKRLAAKVAAVDLEAVRAAERDEKALNVKRKKPKA